MPNVETPLPIDPNDGIAPAMWEYLNSWPNIPVYANGGIGLDHLDKLPPSLVLQQMSGVLVVRRYMDGGFIGRWPFGVFIKVQGDDTASRLSAVNILNNLYAWMRQNLPSNVGTNRVAIDIEQRETPVRIGAYEDGTELYQGLYALVYQERKG